MGLFEIMRVCLTGTGGGSKKADAAWAQLRAQSELPISSDFINFEILVFVTLPHWILKAVLH